MSIPEDEKDEYVLGHSELELQRLISRAEILRPLTERVLREAGVMDGMRVLDVGCGAGDVSFLIASIVGPTGSVVGIDRSETATDTARKRARELGITNASFLRSGLESFDNECLFDAVVGRLILHHQPDPALFVRRAAAHVRKGGLVIFHELDLSLRCISSWPVVPLYEKYRAWTIEAQARSGLDIEIGKKLYHTFTAAGLAAPEMRMERAIGHYSAATMALNLTELVRSLLPKIIEFGIASHEEIQIETLVQRLDAELTGVNAIMIGTPMMGAWSRK